MFCALQYHSISMWRLQVSYITIEGMKFWDRFYPNSHQQTYKKQRFFVVIFVVLIVVYSRTLTILLTLDTIADMGMTQFFRFESTQSRKVLILTQLMTHNGFQELIQINSRLEMVFWNLIQIDSRLKWLSRIWIQVDSRLKKLSRVLIQISSQLKRLSRSFIQID